MKRTIALLFVICFVFFSVACGDANKPADTKVDTESSIEVDEGLLLVDVTLPASFFDGETEEEILEGAKAKGINDCKLNEDGSVTYTMSKAKQREMLEALSKSLEETLFGFVEGEESVESFIDIKHNKDFSKIDVYVNPDLYSEWDSFYAIALYMTGVAYQSLDGVAEDDIDVIVQFIDNNTQEVLNSGSYKVFNENIASAE